MDGVLPQVLEEGRILEAAHAVTDAQGMKGAERFPDALWTTCCTRVCGTGKMSVCHILIGRDVGGDGEASLVTCQVQRGDTLSAKPLDQFGRLEALFGR